MDHKQSITLKIYMNIIDFEVREETVNDDPLCASLSNTPAVFETAG